MERPRACGLRRLHPAHRRARVLRAEVRQTGVGANALAVAETDASEEGRGDGREVDGTVVAHVAKLAADVLGVDASSVDGDDSFAQLGGASLEAQRLLYALRSAPTSSMGTLNYVGGWDRMTPADIIAADTPRRIAAAAMNGSPSDGTGGALTTAGMFAEAAREAKEIGVGMWDARGVWNPLEASGSDEVVKGVKPSSKRFYRWDGRGGSS